MAHSTLDEEVSVSPMVDVTPLEAQGSIQAFVLVWCQVDPASPTLGLIYL